MDMALKSAPEQDSGCRSHPGKPGILFIKMEGLWKAVS